MKRDYLKHLGFTTSVALLTANKSTMDNNTQLPAEVTTQIEKQAEVHNARLKEHAESDKDEAYAQGFAEGWGEGATKYATKLHQVETETEYKANEIERLRQVVAKHKSGRTYQEQKSAIDHMRTLLSKFISRHEAGLLPDRFIYDEIKTFLK